jgi:hypothetical protein
MTDDKTSKNNAGIFDEVVGARFAAYTLIHQPIRNYFVMLSEIVSGVGGLDPADLYAKITTAAGIKQVAYPVERDAAWFDNALAAINAEELAFVAWQQLVGVVRDDVFYDLMGRSLSHTKMQKVVADRKFIMHTWARVNDIRDNDNRVLYMTAVDVMVEAYRAQAIEHVTRVHLIGFNVMLLRRLLESNITPVERGILENAIGVALGKLFSGRRVKGAEFLSRYGLTPGPLVSWDEVLAGLPAGAGRIVITYGTRSCTEFSVKGLVDGEYITRESLETLEGAGLNKKFIKRFTTVKTIANGKNTAWGIRVEGEPPYTIIESLAEGSFRIMSGTNTIPAVTSLLEGVSIKCEEYHREFGLSNPFDRAYRYIAQDIVTRQPRVPAGEADAFVTLMGDLMVGSPISAFAENMRVATERAFISAFNHKALAVNQGEATIAYLLHVEPLIVELGLRMAATVSALDTKLLTAANMRAVVTSTARDVISGMIDDELLVDYDNTFKIVYMEKKISGAH